MSLGTIHRIVACIVAAAALAASGNPAGAGEPSPETQARDLAAEVMREAGNGDLGAWTRNMIDRALERAGEAARGAAAATGTGTPLPAERHAARIADTRAGDTRAAERAGEAARDAAAGTGAGAPPLPAERHAARVGARFAGRPGAGEVLVFMSLSVPAASWRQWARDAARAGAPLLLRGVADGGLRETMKAVGERLGGAEAGVAIDPRLFRLFGVERVPAVAVVPGGVAPCRSRGCAGDPPPPHDLVTGNIGLAAALETIAIEGDAGRDTARRHLERVNGEDR